MNNGSRFWMLFVWSTSAAVMPPTSTTHVAAGHGVGHDVVAEPS